MWKILLAVLALGMPSYAWAGNGQAANKVAPRTHAEFMRGCQIAAQEGQGNDAVSMIRATSCLEYVRGMLDILGATGPFKLGKIEICEKGDLPVMRVVRRMVAIETDNPDIAKDTTDRISVLLALSQLAPCE